MSDKDRTIEKMKEDASKTVCNMCGKPFDVFDELQGIKKDRWFGYGSHHDMSHLKLNLCNKCFDKVMDYVIPQCKGQVVTDPCFEYLDEPEYKLTDEQKTRIKKLLTDIGARKKARISSQLGMSYTPEYLNVVEEEMRQEGYDIDSIPLDMNTYNDWLTGCLEKMRKRAKELEQEENKLT